MESCLLARVGTDPSTAITLLVGEADAGYGGALLKATCSSSRGRRWLLGDAGGCARSSRSLCDVAGRSARSMETTSLVGGLVPALVKNN